MKTINIPALSCQRILCFVLMGYLLLLSFNTLAVDTKHFSQRQDVQLFIQDMVNKHQFNQNELTALFDEVAVQPEVLASIANPAEQKPWYQYKQVFLQPERSKEGVAFWQQHEKTLERAQKEYGVPPSVIISILGVETLYGRFQGRYRVIDALSTLTFLYPPRSAFFRKELEEFLLLSRENAIPATRFKGSYAGAIGQPQFMPSSYRHYAVAYSGNRIKDLQQNTDDVILSVANYLQKNGWESNKPIAVIAEVQGHTYQTLNTANMKPTYPVAQLLEYGIKPSSPLSKDDKASFLILETENAPEYWLGLQNFYAITRYNPRINYAMAVYQLSAQIEQLKNKNTAGIADKSIL